ncbi:trehalose-6-phosphate synthase [Paraburkholderia sp. CNPSo 3155]|uniref:alpha,alpha-trehalose-phosphate synthase (UDP-forming) n=1 Tax=Paraburkholderia atlantica TaxID=2654982 RepID=UPI00128E6B35|nr:trehalose-6-phosphate synthase [Paraburkholderia atlantica]
MFNNTIPSIYSPTSTQDPSDTVAITESKVVRKSDLPRSRPAQFDELPGLPRRYIASEKGSELCRSISDASALSSSDRRLVVVSNRLIDPNKPAAGGLAVALGEMMHNTDGLWFGWSGKTTDASQVSSVRTESFGRTTLAQIDLSKKLHHGYYEGFSNSVLWPVFHEKLKFADLNPEYFKDYETVNNLLASKLGPMLRENDIVWVHDYHLIPFAQQLRAHGCQHRIGFFNHIPLPPPDVIKQIPEHRKLMEGLMSYDLVGMQRPEDVENFRSYAEKEGLVQRLNERDSGAFRRKPSIQAFPIGIDVESLRALQPSSESEAILDDIRNESGRRKLMVGVDRLDYSKGIPKRLMAFRELLETRPDLRNNVTLVQIAAPTRQTVPAYAKLSDKTRKLVDEINDQFGAIDWKPVMYFNESVDRNALPEIYRMSRVGVVTPVADGMNLVAKEYIAAQNPENPGVLVLSTGAGSASQLSDSLLVPPKDRTAIAKAYVRALEMPRYQRQDRHVKLMRNVKTEDLRWWRETYLNALSPSQASAESKSNAIAEADPESGPS